MLIHHQGNIDRMMAEGVGAVSGREAPGTREGQGVLLACALDSETLLGVLGARDCCLFKPLRNQTRSIFLSERLRVNNLVD